MGLRAHDFTQWVASCVHVRTYVGTWIPVSLERSRSSTVVVREASERDAGERKTETGDKRERANGGFLLRTRRSQIRNAAHVCGRGPFGRYRAGICSPESSVRNVARDPRGRGKNALVLLSRAVTSFLPATTTRGGRKRESKHRQKTRTKRSLRERNRRRCGEEEPSLRIEVNVVCVCVWFAFVTFSSSMLRERERFFLQGLQIACQLDHNRDQGSQDNLTLRNI